MPYRAVGRYLAATDERLQARNDRIVSGIDVARCELRATCKLAVVVPKGHVIARQRHQRPHKVWHLASALSWVESEVTG